MCSETEYEFSLNWSNFFWIGISNQLKDSYLSHGHSHSPVSVSTSSSASGIAIGHLSSNNAYYSLPPGKYQENGDTLSDFVNLVCQEAQNNGNGQQVRLLQKFPKLDFN